ncbi:ParB/RepB/Spo0J family partition protein [Streptomyces rectiverticillatus]|uniref:ParB/RepB/Spo0J family partition protein n=1 Tax=Streptomyces rectiverticillatus TaxID=173860 RepID=UPI0015C3E7DC|nr:ParB/RepB/Spo0J family partition protein [Streptomyces rectiverticillatus]QLE73000.1 ParB/RepB/Spo0J family partition protein [Streptomyces rectiverticillatus]
MSDRRRGLGRGLGALIPAAPKASESAGPAGGPDATSPTAVPVLAPERGVAASKVTTLPVKDFTVSRETDAEVLRAEAAAAAAASASVEMVAGAHFAELPLDAIKPNRHQPRKAFDDVALAELVHSIREVGLLQPVVVRPLGSGRYELIMGERRLRASRKAGLERIPAIVRATEDDKLLLDALLENLHRAQLNPLEEAAAYDQLLKDFNCTHDELADRIGRSRPMVTNTLRLLKLTPVVQKKVAAGVLMAGHARALVGVTDPEEQENLAGRIVAEGLSVRTVEEIVKTMDPGKRRTSKSKGPRAGARVSPALTDLATRLSDRFETRVKVDLGQKKGKIVVEFASMEDLERILGTLAPGEGRVLEQKLSHEDENED